MNTFDIFSLLSNGLTIGGSDKDDLIIGSFGDDDISANAGNDFVFGLFGDDTISGGDGEDRLYGNTGDDRIVGNKGDDAMFGGKGDDLLVWNNGDGSDLMNGGSGYDAVQVNFNTDLVNDDLQNKDVAAFSVTPDGVQFARIEVNDQTERGLFQLDIRETEVLETNFGGGDDTAVLKGGVLDEIKLNLDGGAGIDTLDLSELSDAAQVNLVHGTLNGSAVTGFENIIGTEFNDLIKGNATANVVSGLGGEDKIFGRAGDDTLIGGKGDDKVYGGAGDDLLVWNNGDGSDLMVGGKGVDQVQVNFDTDLVNDDLQNKDVAEFSTTAQGVQFARIEVNDQTERGLFQLDIRKTEALETNFGGGNDTAVIVGNVLAEIELDLDGGEGVDTLDFGQSSGPIAVDLASGAIEIDNGPGQDATAVNFENVTGTAGNDFIFGNDQNNVIRGGAGNDVMIGGAGADSFVFFEGDAGIDLILDFERGVDSLIFATSDPSVTADSLLAGLSQSGDDVELAVNNKVITFEDSLVADFSIDDFQIA
jgi:Ca2+-binding RTX toxin-like protein